MRTHGKKFRAAAKNRDEASVYQPKQALEIVKKSAFAKFDETVEVAVRLGVDPRHADQIVRGTVVLPAGTGKSVRVLVVAVGDKAREAEAAGADFVGAEHIAKIKEGWLDFDVMIATPDQMGQVGQLGRVTRAQIRKIAEIKMPDLNCDSLESAMAMVAGAARSMGVEVVD